MAVTGHKMDYKAWNTGIMRPDPEGGGAPWMPKIPVRQAVARCECGLKFGQAIETTVANAVMEHLESQEYLQFRRAA